MKVVNCLKSSVWHLDTIEVIATGGGYGQDSETCVFGNKYENQ